MVKTIVYIHDQAYISGGAAKIAIQAAVGLHNRGYRVIYFCALGPADEALKNSGVEVVETGGEHIGQTKNPKALLNGLWNKNAEKQLVKLLETLDPAETIVHVHGWTKALSASIFTACKKSGFRTFVTMHDYFTVCGNGGFYNYRSDCICKLNPQSGACARCNCDKNNYINKIYRNIRQRKTRRALLKCRPDVIYISRFSRRVLEPYVDFAGRSYLVENHVEVSREQKVDVKSNDAYLFIGRVSDEKGPDLFCEAVTKAKVKGIVVGEGPLREKLKEKYPSIEFTGWIPFAQIKDYLEKARCVIITSKLYETMGLTVIEAQSRGIPCIAPDNCAASENIEDGKNGLIYKIGDVSELVKQIEKIKNNETAEALGDAFYNAFDPERFSMETHTARLSEVYDS